MVELVFNDYRVLLLHFKDVKEYTQVDTEDLAIQCAHYINSWLNSYIVLGVPCHIVLFCRFVYTRYAHGIIADQTKLFSKLIVTAMSIFTLHMLLIWPIHYTLSIGTTYSGTIKGRICTHSHIPEFFEETVNLQFSVKPKLTSLAWQSTFLFSSIYFYNSAKKQQNLYEIPGVRQNMIDMRGNTVFVVVILLNTMSDQLLNIPIEMFYDTLGAKGAFQVWWCWHLFIFFNIHIIGPIMIISDAYKNFLEFRGFEPKLFPGQEGPRHIEILPHQPEIKMCEGAKKKPLINNEKVMIKKTKMVNRKIKVYKKVMPLIAEHDDSLTAVIVH